MKSKFKAIIPARYASSRFPGKPLALINGVPMILRVWEKAKEVLEEVYIATDHQEIYDIAKIAGANVLMTSSSLGSGTERVAEAAKQIFTSNEPDSQIIINIQGDEPLISSDAILGLCHAFNHDNINIATLVHKLTDQSALQNPNRPKVVFDRDLKALYFSRTPIPWVSSPSEPFHKISSYQHIGIYGFRYTVLQELISLSPTPLEQAEKLEQLRWLEHGYSIHCIETDYTGFGIDVPEDLEILNRKFGAV